jgi:hypothetical protein
MAHDALGTDARDKLGISEVTQARPLQTPPASAMRFAAGAALPLIVTARLSSGCAGRAVDQRIGARQDEATLAAGLHW